MKLTRLQYRMLKAQCLRRKPSYFANSSTLARMPRAMIARMITNILIPLGFDSGGGIVRPFRGYANARQLAEAPGKFYSIAVHCTRRGAFPLALILE